MLRARTRFAALSVLLVVAAIGAFSALPASAAVYTIMLKNGTTFETRYQPEQASWDVDKVVLLTEFGNPIALAGADIESISVDSENRGFGHQLNDTTMMLGSAPNDALDPSSEEGKAALAAEAAASSGTQASPAYNQQQFVDTGATTGFPGWMTQVNAVPQVAPPPSPPQQ